MANNQYIIPKLPLSDVEIETKAVLKQLNLANKKLAELKGIAHTIPNETILINTLVLQEAKDSSAVENIITTHDELYKAGLDYNNFVISPSTKEVLDYVDALKYGYQLVKKDNIISTRHIKEIQQILEHNTAGFRSVPGTTLKDAYGKVVYTPPQDLMQIEDYMSNLQSFINCDDDDLDPLIKMAIIHHQIESIHPFYDGNGRTGRIINVLYLVIKDLLDIPILYLSRFIINNKAEYYRLLQNVRDTKDWKSWILFMLKGVEETASQTIATVKEISQLMRVYKVRIKETLGKDYSHELLNNLFNHPYTKIEFIMKDVNTSRHSATSYLNKLTDAGLLSKVKMGRYNYYLNVPLLRIFANR